MDQASVIALIVQAGFVREEHLNLPTFARQLQGGARSVCCGEIGVTITDIPNATLAHVLSSTSVTFEYANMDEGRSRLHLNWSTARTNPNPRAIDHAPDN